MTGQEVDGGREEVDGGRGDVEGGRGEVAGQEVAGEVDEASPPGWLAGE